MKIIISEQQNEKLNRKIRFAVEKLGLKQARQSFGDEIIKQVYSDNPLSYLEQFNNLRPVNKDSFIYYVGDDNLPLFAINEESIEQGYGPVYIDPHNIWNFFYKVMDLGFHKTTNIINSWLTEKYELGYLYPTTSGVPILVIIQWSEPVN